MKEAGDRECCECLYCGAQLDSDYTPPVSADAEWDRLAEQHVAGCEWITTRAHRVESE